MPPVEMWPGNVLPEIATRPVSIRKDVFEKLRERCSSGFWWSYWAATKTL
jgi:hypothetical protein